MTGEMDGQKRDRIPAVWFCPRPPTITGLGTLSSWRRAP
jgi:hypothetical protein